jgi:hypothetical protein
LLGLPPAWGGTLGFMIAAVSPAVVVPGMLDLGARGYGVAKGIPTMVVAAASFDDVLAIAGFGVCLALAAATEATATDAGVANTNSTLAANGGVRSSPSLTWLVLKAPTELVAGIAFGIIYGTFAAAPASEHALLRGGKWFGHTDAIGPGGHTSAVVAGALLSVLGGKRVGFSGGGALAAIVLGVTAGRLWTKAAITPVRAHVNAAWAFLQPALFGLLGAAVDLSAIDGSQLGNGLGLLAIGLTVRILVTRLAVLRSGLSPKESLLVCIAWLPKATVQAAVGGTALDLMRENGHGPEAEARGQTLLMLSVLIILLTAPVGALGIAIFGPKWLSLDASETTTNSKDAPSSLSSSAPATASQQSGEQVVASETPV